MTKAELMEKLQELMRDVFDNDEIEIDEDTTAEDIEEWDSLTNIQLVDAIEKAFGLKLTSKEIVSWDDVGEMADALLNKIN
ncbi:MAG: acyl carrier protein [Prevotella sp.]|jgi:acyl carrier protein|nr:acyl carrier protein [Prevotella sp.]MCI2088597.1 acyl carrier protein [Prevotella sp.]MCI2125830.1 acyl carrier protein [Prevotella sp.]